MRTTGYIACALFLFALMTRASVTVSPANTVSVPVDFNEAGTKRFAEITGANIGRRLAIIFDGKLLSAPTIRSVIRDKAVITGQCTAAEAEVIVNALNARQRGDVKASKTTANPVPVTQTIINKRDTV